MTQALQAMAPKLGSFVKALLSFGLTMTLIQTMVMAQTAYTPLRLSGFNHDGIANGVTPGGTVRQAGLSTTTTLDNPSFSSSVLYGKDFRGAVNSSTAPPFGLPTDGFLIANQNNFTDVYRTAPFEGPNIAVLTGADSIDLIVAPSQPANKVNLLVFSSEGASVLRARLFFDGGATDSSYFAPITIADWFLAANTNVLNRIGRVSRNTDQFSGTATNPHLDRAVLNLAPAQQGAYINRIRVAKNAGTSYLMVLAASVANVLDAPTVGNPNVLSFSAFNINWLPNVPNPTNYYYEVARDSLFTDYFPGKKNVRTTSANLNISNLTNSGTFAYFRVRTEDANGDFSAFSDAKVVQLRPTSLAGRMGGSSLLQLFPNPAKVHDGIQIPTDATDLTVVNNLGQLVQFAIIEGQLVINTPGLYLVRLRSQGIWHQGRILIDKP